MSFDNKKVYVKRKPFVPTIPDNDIETRARIQGKYLYQIEEGDESRLPIPCKAFCWRHGYEEGWTCPVHGNH